MTEFITPNLVGFIALALFMWKITRDISGVEKRLTEKIDGVTNRLSELGERVAHIEGLLEGECKRRTEIISAVVNMIGEFFGAIRQLVP